MRASNTFIVSSMVVFTFFYSIFQLLLTTTRHGAPSILSWGTKADDHEVVESFDAYGTAIITRETLRAIDVADVTEADVITFPLVGLEGKIVFDRFPKDVNFTYDAFKMAEPNFIDAGDVEKFRKHKHNKELMQQDDRKLRGVVRMINNGSFRGTFRRPGCGWESMFDEIKADDKMARSSATFRTGVLCPLTVPDGGAFQHFLDGVLPKIIQVYDLLRHKDAKLLLHRPRDGIILEILKKIGFDSSKLVFHGKGSYKAGQMIYTCITPPLHPTLWQGAQKLLGVPDRLTVPREEAYVILLTRKKSYNGGRKMLNRIAVQSFLEDRYGKDKVIVYPGRYNLSTSISVFGKARILIGVHGGALYNVYFASRDVSVVEFLPSDDVGNPVPTGIAHTIFWSMCNMLNQSYWRIYAKAKTGNGNVIVDLAKLRKALDWIDLKT